MIDPPKIVQTTAQQTAMLHLTIPQSEIRKLMGPGIQEVMGSAKAQGIGPTGPWFTHHFKFDPGFWNFDICVPVSGLVKPVGRVVPGEWPAMTVARTTYRGPFEGLADAWKEFDAWIEANGHKPAEDFFEVYAVGPESSPDPANWRTELSRPLVR